MSSAGEQGGQSQPPRRTAPSWLSQAPEKLWEEQLASQFKARSAGAAINTIVEWPSVNHVPVMIGALPSSPRLIKLAEGVGFRGEFLQWEHCWELALDICC